jgi:triacylglycerol lipase
MRRLLIATALLVGCGEAEPVEGTPAPAPESKQEAAEATDQGKADWSVDVCDWNGWYGDGACDWFCLKRDQDCNAEPLGPAPAGQATKYPVVLAHGFDASPSNRWGWYRVPEALEADGHTVFVTMVPPYNTVAVRAAHLARQIDTILEDTGAERVNLVAHSMGGLDGRYLISSLGYGNAVASLTTISTPHRGSAVADVALKLLPGLADRALNALASAWGRTYSELADDSDLRGAMAGISEANLPGFNADNPDDPQVHYQSWAGVSSVLGLNHRADAEACEGMLLQHPGSSDKMNATLVPMAGFVAHGTKLYPNDGMVRVDSAKWGDFRGCIPADHLDEVGQVRNEGADPHTGFDAPRFYRNVVFELAEQGL